MKILIISPSWIGDAIIAQGLYRTLKSIYNQINIDVIAPEWCYPVIKYMPEVKNIFKMPINHGVLDIKKRYNLSKVFKQKNYDEAYILPNSFKSALIPFFAKIKKRIGWKGEMRYFLLNDIRTLKKNLFPSLLEQYIALAYSSNFVKSANDLPKPLKWPKLKINKKEKNTIFSKFSMIANQKNIIGICPGSASFKNKRWPDYYYSLLISKLIEKKYKIILFGSKFEKEIGKNIIKNLKKEQKIFCNNLIGKTSLEEAITILTCCSLVVSNDSGLMHVTAALNIPILGLYGPSNPFFTPPLSLKSKIIYNKKKLNNSNFLKIKPKFVLNEIKKLLKKCYENFNC